MKSVKKAIPAKVKAAAATETSDAKVKPATKTKAEAAAPKSAGKSVAAAKIVTSGAAAKSSQSAKTGKSRKAAKSVRAAKSVKAVKTVEGEKSFEKPKKAKVSAKPTSALKDGEEGTAKLLDSRIAYEGPLFKVLRDHLIEPGGQESYRDVIRHNGSVVILAVDPSKHKPKKDPWIVIERQYRHAAGQFLWELPAGKLDAGESPLEGAKRELGEETGYSAEKWSPLVEYFASPGFLGESMKVFLAEGLIAGEAHPEEDEKIDFRLVRLSELLEMVDKGKIIDGKTLTTVLLYARKLGLKRKK